MPPELDDDDGLVGWGFQFSPLKIGLSGGCWVSGTKYCFFEGLSLHLSFKYLFIVKLFQNCDTLSTCKFLEGNMFPGIGDIFSVFLVFY